MPANQSTPEVTRADREAAGAHLGLRQLDDGRYLYPNSRYQTRHNALSETLARHRLAHSPARGGDELREAAFAGYRLQGPDGEDYFNDTATPLSDDDRRNGWVETPLYALASTDMAGAGEERHPDDAAVDRFAATMKAKLAAARAKGRSGWDDPAQCSTAYLNRLLHEHVAKGDPVDVANFCMMLAHYGALIAAPPVEGLTSGGKRSDADLLRLIAKDHARLAPNAYHSAETLEQIADRLDAPKAAATASVRETLARAIDPEAFEPTDNYDQRISRDMRRAEAYSAADRVRALTHSGTAATIGGERA